jgi:hypothetical protein
MRQERRYGFSAEQKADIWRPCMRLAALLARTMARFSSCYRSTAGLFQPFVGAYVGGAGRHLTRHCFGLSMERKITAWPLIVPTKYARRRSALLWAFLEPIPTRTNLLVYA